ncbi:MAG: cbb3-type cytochrome oxidase assembly protein CcoS [Gemmatimonadales bacterium]|nr:cbb3-type cytochrome oxidase assembly protein CcoS [Gemmatimonadales bacterium]
MRAYYLLLPLALLVGGIFLGLLLKAMRDGQFDDLDDPPQRILHDQD